MRSFSQSGDNFRSQFCTQCNNQVVVVDGPVDCTYSTIVWVNLLNFSKDQLDPGLNQLPEITADLLRPPIPGHQPEKGGGKCVLGIFLYQQDAVLSWQQPP